MEFLNSNSPVWLLVLLGFGSLALTIVGVYRKWKSGEIEDDGTLLDRMGADNVNLRQQLDLANVKLEDERLRRMAAEESDALHRRQLIDEGFIPKEVRSNG
jgi:hypothetical protein